MIGVNDIERNAQPNIFNAVIQLPSLQGSTGATVRAAAQSKLGVTLPPASGQLVIMRSNQLKTAQDVANAVILKIDNYRDSEKTRAIGAVG